MVWPLGFDTLYVVPLAFGYLKSNLDTSEHEVRIIDCALRGIAADSPELQKELNEFRPQIVGVSCWSPTYGEALRILRLAKEIDPEVVTVMGGAHVTAYPDAAMKNAFVDFIFRGEAELAFPRFLDKMREKEPRWSSINGLIYRSQKNAIIKNDMKWEQDLDRIKLPDYDAINLQAYLDSGYRFLTQHKRNAPVWVTRGCPYRCEFCSASLQNGKVVRTHSVGYMVKWVKYLYYKKGIRLVNIIDDNFTYHTDYAKEFCRAMIALGLPDLHFSTPNGIRLQRSDAELFRLMRQAGWETVVVAPESGSVRTLKTMRKDLDPAIVPQRVEEIQKAGLKVHGLFIIGYPGETREDLQETVRLLRKCKFNFFFLSNFQPLPGTPVYDRLVEQGEIPEGLLPTTYSSGERVYVPETLRDFNFPALVLKEYLHLALAYPSNVPYMLRLMNPRMVIKRVCSNLRNMVLPHGKGQR